jgi:hypothetical protein
MCRLTGRYIIKLVDRQAQDRQVSGHTYGPETDSQVGTVARGRVRILSEPFPAVERERVRQVLMVHHQGWLREAVQDSHGHLGVGDLVVAQQLSKEVRKKQEGNNRGGVLIKHLNMNQVNGLFSKLDRIKI